MDDFIIHIHLYLTSRETELTAYNNLKRLKNAGFNILVTSPKPLPLDFYPLVKHFYYDSENQIMELEYEKPEPIVWWNHTDSIGFNFIVDGFQKHSLAVLRSMIKGCNIAKGLGYKNIIRFEFDDIFGYNSLNKIKQICKEIKDHNYDFYAYKNDYGNNKIDLSVHLIFYSIDSFLQIFGNINNEHDYKNCLKYIGLENKSIILEEFLYLLIKNENINILYQDGRIMHEVFNDTGFNIHQSPIGVFNGALSDVMRIIYKDKQDLDNLCVGAKNISSEVPVNIYFDIYNKDLILINTIKIDLYSVGEWKYEYLNDIKNIELIKIRHQDNQHHKTYRVYFNFNGVNIENVDLITDIYIPEIIFK